MDTAAILQLVFERFAASQTLWNLYITVVLGMVGFAAAAAQALAPRWIRAVVACAFLAFALVNLRTLAAVHDQRTHLIALAEARAEPADGAAVAAVIASAQPPETWQLTSFHLAIDVAVVALIWAIPAYRRAGAETAANDQAQ